MGSKLTQLKARLRGVNKGIILPIALFVLAGVFGAVHSVHAGFFDFLGNIAETALATIVNGILFALVWTFGKIIALTLIPALIFVASYNDFATEWGVQLGWTVVRDVANMFFIIVLLVIAVATIFKVESYSYRALLPKLIIMAILINFSRTITGFFIDISQIIMLTFVNAFRNIAAGNLIDGLGLVKILEFSPIFNDEASALAAVGSMILGLAVTVVSAGVLLVLVVVLAFRIIMLWMLTILSPLAFLLSVFPGGQKYSSQWWEKLTGHLIVGPVLAFFLWLSFTIMQNNLWTQRPGSSFEQLTKQEQGQNPQAFNPFGTTQGQLDSMINFIIVIGLLMGSLTITSQLGVLGGSIAGTVAGKLGTIGYGAGMFLPGRLFGMARQKWNERTARLLEQHPGEEPPGAGKKLLFALLNPVAAAKGWEARSAELREHAQKIAHGRGREVTEQFRTRGQVKIPYAAQVNAQIAAEFAKDYAFMSRDEKAAAMARLMTKRKGKKNEEIQRHTRALMRVAAEGGHWDDITMSKRFRDDTGNKYGKVYGRKQLYDFLKDTLGDHEDGLRLLNVISEDISKRNTHTEYAGFEAYDAEHEIWKFAPTMESALHTNLTETNKLQYRVKRTQAPHAYSEMAEAPVVWKDVTGAIDLRGDRIQVRAKVKPDGTIELDAQGRPILDLQFRASDKAEGELATTRTAFTGVSKYDAKRDVQGREALVEAGGSQYESSVDREQKYAHISVLPEEMRRIAKVLTHTPNLLRAAYEVSGGEEGALRVRLYDPNDLEVIDGKAYAKKVIELEDERELVDWLNDNRARFGITWEIPYPPPERGGGGPPGLAPTEEVPPRGGGGRGGRGGGGGGGGGAEGSEPPAEESLPTEPTGGVPITPPAGGTPRRRRGGSQSGEPIITPTTTTQGGAPAEGEGTPKEKGRSAAIEELARTGTSIDHLTETMRGLEKKLQPLANLPESLKRVQRDVEKGKGTPGGSSASTDEIRRVLEDSHRKLEKLLVSQRKLFDTLAHRLSEEEEARDIDDKRREESGST